MEGNVGYMMSENRRKEDEITEASEMTCKDTKAPARALNGEKDDLPSSESMAETCNQNADGNESAGYVSQQKSKSSKMTVKAF